MLLARGRCLSSTTALRGAEWEEGAALAAGGCPAAPGEREAGAPGAGRRRATAGRAPAQRVRPRSRRRGHPAAVARRSAATGPLIAGSLLSSGPRVGWDGG